MFRCTWRNGTNFVIKGESYQDARRIATDEYGMSPFRMERLR